MDKNQGYAILKAVMLENGRGFALGEHPTAPSRYVTWACYDDKDGQRQYEWGHYGSDRAALEQDFAARVQEYQRLYNVDVRQVEAPGLYKYYLYDPRGGVHGVQRPGYRLGPHGPVSVSLLPEIPGRRNIYKGFHAGAAGNPLYMLDRKSTRLNSSHT